MLCTVLSKTSGKIIIDGYDLDTEANKIRDVIGSGGKTINEIIEKCNNVKIDIEQDGRVFVMHQDQEWIDKAVEIITDLTREVEVGKYYTGKVVRVEKFGAFVELWKGCEGLLHISKIAKEKLEKVEDALQIGDEIIVCVTEIDEKGRVNLATKAGLEKKNEAKDDKKSDKPHREKKFNKKEKEDK